jgi:hypothetical protein
MVRMFSRLTLACGASSGRTGLMQIELEEALFVSARGRR